MKSVGEVLGELLVGCLRSLTPKERKDLLEKGKMQGKRIEFILPNENEACVVHFEHVEAVPWLSYEGHATPNITCKNCGWKGNWKDLEVKEEEMRMTGIVTEFELFKPIYRTVIEKCIKCDSKSLKYKDWVHDDVDLIIKGTFADIGAVAEILIGGTFHKIKQLFKVLWLLLRGRVAIKPLTKLGTAIKVSRLLTGKVSEDYKED